MSFSLKVLPTEPILVVKLERGFSLEELVQVWVQSAEIIEGREGTMYRIIDATQLAIDLTEAFHYMLMLTRVTDCTGSLADARFVDAVVLSEYSLTTLTGESLTPVRESGIELLLYGSLAEALAGIRHRLAVR